MDTILNVTLHGKVARFRFDNVDDAVSKIHRVAKNHGYSCLVDYQDNEPQLSWTLVRMEDNHTVGRAFIR